MKNKSILFSGIIVAMIVFYTEFSGFAKIWQSDSEPVGRTVQMERPKPIGRKFKKIAPINCIRFIKLNISTLKNY